MKRVVLDTNFLLLPCTERIDVFTEIARLIMESYELVTPAGVIKELERIREGIGVKGQHKTAASVALKLIEKKKVRILEGAGGVDAQITQFAAEDPANTIVCTNDKALRRTLRGMGAAVIGMRSRTHLDFA
jgi:rRNA-processing protein FCF1